jgi:hypothetical protein
MDNEVEIKQNSKVGITVFVVMLCEQHVNILGKLLKLDFKQQRLNTLCHTRGSLQFKMFMSWLALICVTSWSRASSGLANNLTWGQIIHYLHVTFNWSHLKLGIVSELLWKFKQEKEYLERNFWLNKRTTLESQVSFIKIGHKTLSAFAKTEILIRIISVYRFGVFKDGKWTSLWLIVGISVKQHFHRFNKALVHAGLIKMIIISTAYWIQDSSVSWKTRRQVGFTQNVWHRPAIQSVKNPRLFGLIDKRWRLIGVKSCDWGRGSVILSNCVSSRKRTVINVIERTQHGAHRMCGFW